MNHRCTCTAVAHEPRLVALTGGPGAGKTAVLEVVRRVFCQHVLVLPEAASIVFGGGFPRRSSEAARRAAQRAIYHVQVELQRLAVEEAAAALVLCDRGTLDGLAYWPGSEASFFADLATDRAAELGRYDAVIHLHTPPESGYNHRNPLRIESSDEAALLDERIVAAWAGHPRRLFVGSADRFTDKLGETVERVRELVPPCCLPAPRSHR